MNFLNFPVNFVTIEEELKNVLPLLKGRVLNAGCGNRDISDFLKTYYAEEVENCDIQSSIPGAIICDLTAIPKEGKYYDAILCNAVLEHVKDARAVMEEFKRLLRDDGHLIISVPFLQPYHPTPTDFRRFTYEGLHRLAAHAGFSITRIIALHSLAQTLGWIIWAALEERESFLGKALFKIPIYLATLFFKTAPNNVKYTANSFQAVMVKID